MKSRSKRIIKVRHAQPVSMPDPVAQFDQQRPADYPRIMMKRRKPLERLAIGKVPAGTLRDEAL